MIAAIEPKNYTLDGEEHNVREIWRIFLTHECKRVLDAGCGTGWFGEHKPGNLVEVFGVDIDQEKLKEAMKHEMVVNGDVRNLPFANGFFDGIHASHIIEHVLENFALMKEFNRALKVGGVLIAVSPSPWCGNFWDDYTHVRPYTHESFAKLARDAGFEVLSCHYLGGLPMPLLGRLRLFSLATKLRASLANLRKKWRGNVFLVAMKSKNSRGGIK